ncbi:MAG: LysR family transcriptional regulator [Atopobiaceae bacterium]|nr:LysR family transcriptional regulator [Atopobiaceae bacterium]
MDSRQAKYFTTLYETRTVRGAADKLFISQQGLSRSIRELEAELDVQLFTRSSRGMTPTRAGTYFYERIRPLLETFEDICHNVTLVRNDAERIEVPCSYGALFMLYRPLKEFDRTHDLDVSLEQTTDRGVERKILGGQREMGICARSPFETGLEFRRVYLTPFVAFMRDDAELAKKDVIRVDDLRDYPIVHGGPEYNTSRIFFDHCMRCGFEPKIAMETPELTLSLRLAKMGEGIAVLPEAVAEMCSTEGMVRVPFEDVTLRWEVGLVWKAGSKPSGAYQQLADWLL